MTELTLAEYRANHAAAMLFEHLKAVFGGRPCDEATIREVEEMIRDHRTAARHDGIDFPEMVVLPFPRIGAIELVRRDLDEKAIQTVVLNMTVRYPTITAADLAWAVRYAFPNYRLGNLRLEPMKRPN